MTRSDWTLLVLAAAEGASLTPVQLQKALFLIGQNLPHRVGLGYYKFEPYSYGPFDKLVFYDARDLVRAGLAVETEAPRGWKEYAATHRGVATAQALASTIPSDVVEYVGSVVRWCRSLSFGELVRAIYAAYPDMAANSVFKDSQ